MSKIRITAKKDDIKRRTCHCLTLSVRIQPRVDLSTHQQRKAAAHLSPQRAETATRASTCVCVCVCVCWVKCQSCDVVDVVFMDPSAVARTEEEVWTTLNKLASFPALLFSFFLSFSLSFFRSFFAYMYTRVSPFLHLYSRYPMSQVFISFGNCKLTVLSTF